MIVTDIKRQKRNDKCFSVYVDGKYSFSLTDLELSTSGLRTGHELDQQDVAAWQKQGGESKAFALAVRYVGLRPRSRREVAEYLRRKGFGSDETIVAQERLAAAGLLDDREFAHSWVSDRLALRPRSRRMLLQELAAKGVSREDQDAALSALDRTTELDALKGVIEKKRRLPQYGETEKLRGYLARQGYSFDLVKAALEELDAG